MLDERERRILRTVQLRADASIASLSHLTGCSDQAVRYCLRNLLKNNIIQRSIAINYSRLGLHRYNFFFSVGIRNPKDRERLLSALQTMPQISMIAAVGGQFDFEVSFLCRNVWELTGVLETISKLSGGIRGARALSIVQRKVLFGTKALDPAQQCPPLDCLETPGEFNADELDYKILHSLAGGEYDSFRELSRKLDMAPSKLHYRIEALEKAGVIVGHYYRVNDSSMFGLLHYVILLATTDLTPELKDKMHNFAMENESIDIMTGCVGHHDFELTVQANSPEQLELLREKIYSHFGSTLSEIHFLPRFRAYQFSNFPLPQLKETGGENDRKVEEEILARSKLRTKERNATSEAEAL